MLFYFTNWGRIPGFKILPLRCEPSWSRSERKAFHFLGFSGSIGERRTWDEKVPAAEFCGSNLPGGIALGAWPSSREVGLEAWSPSFDDLQGAPARIDRRDASGISGGLRGEETEAAGEREGAP